MFATYKLEYGNAGQGIHSNKLQVETSCSVISNGSKLGPRCGMDTDVPSEQFAVLRPALWLSQEGLQLDCRILYLAE
jgi:hypothetical protein